MPDIAVTLMLLSAALTAAGLLQVLANRLSLPHSVLLAALGVGLGLLTAAADGIGGWPIVGVLADEVGQINLAADPMLNIFLPLLLFQAGLTIDARRLFDDIAPVLMLAVVAVVVCTAAVGVAVWLASPLALVTCLILGAIVSTTDPAAVVGVFRDVGAPRRLTILVEGESLYNDAAAIALFAVLLGLLAADGSAAGFGTVLTFMVQFVGGLAFGYACAWAAGSLVGIMRGLPLAEVTLSVALAYVTFVVAEHVLGISGVTAVATAALVTGATARIRVSNRTWDQMLQVWGQINYWATALVFILAAMLVPTLVAHVTWETVGLIALVAVAALVARAVVLFGLMPLLTLSGLSQPVTRSNKLVILWGGLRGAITLVLALAVTELPSLRADEARTVGALAAGFVLVTLAINAPTLRMMIRLLRLDRLSPVEARLRDRAVAMSMGSVVDKLAAAGRDLHLEPKLSGQVIDTYRERIRSEDQETQGTLSEEDQVRVALVIATNREEERYLHHFGTKGVSRRTVVTLLAKAGRLRDGARVGGSAAYLAAATDSLEFRLAFRVAHNLQRLVGWQRPLAERLADRFESLTITRMVLGELRRFAGTTLSGLVGRSTAAAVEALLHQRFEGAVQALEALRLQYPDYHDGLQTHFLRRSALRLEEAGYRTLFEEAAISGEIYGDLMQRIRRDWDTTAGRPALDLGLDTLELVRRLPFLDGLPEEEVRGFAGLLRPRLAFPDEKLVALGERADSVFFISSGAVEVLHPRHGTILLGSGDFFGELALLSLRRRSADVRAIAYCRLLVLQGRDFRRFARTHPRLRAHMRKVAEARLESNDIEDRAAGGQRLSGAD